jgi:hypothetical protein
MFMILTHFTSGPDIHKSKATLQLLESDTTYMVPTRGGNPGGRQMKKCLGPAKKTIPIPD